MKRILKPYTRLSFIFLLAVIIPGSILTYLSVLHVKNLKELTEKSVLEEERLIIGYITDSIQSELYSITQRVDDILKSNEGDMVSICKTVNNLAYTSNYFVTDEKGNFLWPNYLDPLDSTSNGNDTRPIDQLFSSAETAEFQDGDYPEAERLYFELLALASDQSDSARIINAVARVSIKSGNQTQAGNYYQKLLSYDQQTDQFGFPYINYAVSQLLNLPDKSNNVSLAQDLENVILKMSEGKIPLTLNTKEFLDQLTEWISSRESSENFNKALVRSKINEIQEQLWFIKSYSEMITEQMNPEILDNDVLINSFTPVSSVMDGKSTLLFIKPEINGLHQLGFLVDQEKLLIDIVDGNWRSEFEFDYNIYYKNREPYPSELEGGQISYSKIFSFPSSENIIVELYDPNVINAYVLRTTWIYGIALVLLSGAIVLGVFLVIRDFTRERHMSQLRSDFVSNVTHELKTPLTSIHMFAESILLNRVRDTEDRKEYLQIIMNETARLKRLINNVLDFSKLEEGKIQLHLRESDLSNLVESAVKDLDYWIREKNFKINKHIEKGIYANVDEDALIQAIINLLSNAIRYSGDKQELWLRMSQNEESILIEVEDQGMGIAEDQQKKIFEKFYRVDKGDKPGVTGTGLGLTVTKEIVEAHGGTITVKSTINRGSTFTIEFNKSKMV